MTWLWQSGDVQAATPRISRARRIVLCEDGTRYLHTFRDLLCREGYEVVMVEDAKRARMLVMSSGADLLVLDVVHEDFDPLEFYAEIRREWKDTNLPILFLTSLITEGMADTLNRGPGGRARIEARGPEPERLLPLVDRMLTEN